MQREQRIISLDRFPLARQSDMHCDFWVLSFDCDLVLFFRMDSFLGLAESLSVALSDTDCLDVSDRGVVYSLLLAQLGDTGMTLGGGSRVSSSDPSLAVSETASSSGLGPGMSSLSSRGEWRLIAGIPLLPSLSASGAGGLVTRSLLSTIAGSPLLPSSMSVDGMGGLETMSLLWWSLCAVGDTKQVIDFWGTTASASVMLLDTWRPSRLLRRTPIPRRRLWARQVGMSARYLPSTAL